MKSQSLINQMGIEDLSKYFHLRIEVVAQQLGVCTSAIKRLCRRHGIKRWPQRKLISIQNKIAEVEAHVTQSTLGDDAERQREFLENQRQSLLHNPAGMIDMYYIDALRMPSRYEASFITASKGGDASEKTVKGERPNTIKSSRKGSYMPAVTKTSENQQRYQTKRSFDLDFILNPQDSDFETATPEPSPDSKSTNTTPRKTQLINN